MKLQVEAQASNKAYNRAFAAINFGLPSRPSHIFARHRDWAHIKKSHPIKGSQENITPILTQTRAERKREIERRVSGHG